MFKLASVLSLFNLLVFASVSSQTLCEDATKSLKEADCIYKQFEDTKNALLLLEKTPFNRILYKKPSCIDEQS